LKASFQFLKEEWLASINIAESNIYNGICMNSISGIQTGRN